MNYNQLVDELKEVCKRAGSKILSYYETVDKEIQNQDFPITKADLESSELIIEFLKEKYRLPVLSEEDKKDKEYLNSEKFFLVDPLDGTKDFINHTGQFVIMIALIENSQPTVGIIYQPTTNILYYGIKNKEAFIEKNKDKKKMGVSNENDFTRMKMLVSQFHSHRHETELAKKLLVQSSTKLGSAGLKICRIAQGLEHIYINTSNKTGEWDSAAGSIIIKEAGGEITDCRGNELVFGKEEPYNQDGFVISNGIRHGEIIKNVQEILKNK